MSPSPSIRSTATSLSSTLGLPHPRSHPLRPGSAKEDLVRRYVSERLLHISRRFVKKYGIAEPTDVIIGYASMGELCGDVDALLNNLWKSGTPSLQVQYLLNIASELITWMDGFKPSPKATLSLLKKLDYCFASLLIGEDLETHETLPGFAGGGNTVSFKRVGLSRTDMVRCRSIAEQSRVAVVDVFQRGPPDPLDENGTRRSGHRQRRDHREGTVGTEASTVQGEDTDMERETTAEPTDDDATTLADATEDDEEEEGDIYENDDDDDDINEDTQMGVARVYENTLVKLGEVLGDQPGRIGDFEPPAPDGGMVFEDENDDEY